MNVPMEGEAVPPFKLDGPRGKRGPIPIGRRRKPILSTLASGALSGLLLAGLPVMAAPAAKAAEGDEISGTIWQDYDSNGMLDTYESGLAGVEVYAYDGDGNVAGPVATGADGTYTLPVTSEAEQWRVEANVPDTPEWAEWRDSAVGRADGTDNGTSVQFVDVSAGDIGDVDFSVQVPSTFVENNPNVYLPAYRYGASDAQRDEDEFGGTAHLYDAVSPDTETVVPTTMKVPFSQVGATYGTAWQRAEEPGGVGSVFASAYVRRHSGLGPGGIDAIYRITPDSGELTSPTATADVLVNLSDYGIDVGSDSDPGALPGDPNGLRPKVTVENPTYDWKRDAQAWDKVGRVGLGAMEISNDQQSLFAVNLNNRSLVEVEISRDGTSVAGVTEHELDDYFPDGSDLRPHGISANPLTNEMYLTVTDTAESGTRDDLHAYVYAFDPADPTNLREVLDFPLSYDRGTHHGEYSASYQPWSTNSADWLQFLQGGTALTSVPIVADARYLHGDLIIGIRDLGGDLIGAFTNLAPDNDTIVVGRTLGGELLRAGSNGDGTWTIEQNGVVNGLKGTGGAGAGSMANGPDGPDKFFTDDWLDGVEHLGATLVLPSREDGILETGIHAAEGAFQVGTRRFFQESGATVEPRGAAVITGTNSQVGATLKGNGLGELTALASAAPIEIGNYVWYDIDNDGIQDPEELPVEGATVNLYELDADGNRTLVNTTLTDEKGEYYFSSLDADYQVRTNTEYEVGVDNPVDYGEGGPLDGWEPTVDHTGDPVSLDPERNDSNGIVPEDSPFPYALVTTGGPGENDHTIDFGYSEISYEFDKRVVEGPTPSPDEDGTWSIVYELVAENTGMTDGSYLLTDDLTGYGEGIEIVDTRVLSGPSEAGDLLNPDWNGIDDKRVVTDYVDIDAQSTVDNGTEHIYTLQVNVRLDSDPETGEVLVDPDELACKPDAEPGDDDTTGLFNAATMSPENDDDMDDDAECSELPLVTLDKTLTSAEPSGDGQWEVFYDITVSNTGPAATVYDLEDELLFGDGMEVTDAEVAAAPDGVTTRDDWDGVDQLVIATDVPLAGADDEGYAPHVYTVRAVANVPESFETDDEGNSQALCQDEPGSNFERGGLNNAATVHTEDGGDLADTDCAEVPNEPVPPEDPELPDTGAGALAWLLGAGLLLVLGGLTVLGAARRRARTGTTEQPATLE